MNLFSEIEGRSGEELTTALLRFLILRSPEIRERVIQSISKRSRSGPVVSVSHFSCYSEYPTEHQKLGSGRIDLVIEVDNAVIGIENKLFAELLSSQPEKYGPTLEKLAKRLAYIRLGDVRHILAIFCPEVRIGEIEKQVTSSPELILIAWEDLVAEMHDHHAKLDTATEVILSQFVGFIREQIGFIPKFEDWVPHLRRQFEPQGTPLQRDLVAHIWRFFPNAGRRMSAGSTWVGYYFSDDQSNHKGWYGFVPREELSGEWVREAELAVVTTCPIPGLSDCLKPVELADPNWLQRPGSIYSWVVDFDESWSVPAKWATEFSPFSKAMRDVQ